MAEFTVTITELSHIAGITAAREAFNESLGRTEQERVSHADFIPTDQDYVQFVMSRASESYSKLYNT